MWILYSYFEFDSYGRYVEGTGSLLLSSAETTTEDDDHASTLLLTSKSVRYFKPKEIANLHCFPPEFGNYIAISELH